MAETNGTLYIIATPIGNMEDISYRAVRILSEVDALACEDTRVTKNILHRYEIPFPTQIFSYHEHNELRAADKIIELLNTGQSVALCTDAGNPGVSDPGYRAIAKAKDLNLPVDIIPGPSAVTTALLASGLPTSSFLFKGFPPRKEGQRQRFLELEKELPHTLIFFESKHRIVKFLTSALTVLGNRQCAVCIELTKKFEQVVRGYLSEVMEQLSTTNIKGEITVVIAGNHPKFIADVNHEPEDE